MWQKRYSWGNSVILSKLEPVPLESWGFQTCRAYLHHSLQLFSLSSAFQSSLLLFYSFSISPFLFCSLHVLRLYPWAAPRVLAPFYNNFGLCCSSFHLFCCSISLLSLIWAFNASYSNSSRKECELKASNSSWPMGFFLWPSPWARGYTANFILNAKLEASLQSRLHKSQCLFELQCWVTMVEWHLMSLDSVRFSLKVKDLDPDYTPVLTWSSPRRRTISCHSNFVC